MPGQKEPRTRWRDTATTDRRTIEGWFGGESPAGVGIACGSQSGIVVIDVDDLAAIPKLRERGELPDTLTARTPRGGLHLYYTHPGTQVPNSASKLAEGVDVRGDGGYVCAPPTVLPNGAYTWVATRDLAPLPAWIAEASATRLADSARTEAVGTAATETTRWGATVLERELATLVASPEGARNHGLYHAALKVFGAVVGGELDEQQARSALSVTADRIGLASDETVKTIESARSAARPRAPQEPLRAATHTGVPEAAPAQPQPQADTQPDDGWMSVGDIMDLPPLEWLIPGQIPAGLTMLWGKYGSAKSFTALDWSLALACGLIDGTKHAVAYCLGEGLEGFGPRINAWLQHHEQAMPKGKFLARAGRKFPRLLDPTSVSELCTDIEALDEPPSLIVIDTLARSLSSEEGPREFGQAVRVCDDLRNRYGTSALLVHHAGVNPDRERGATNLPAACDAIWAIHPPEPGGGTMFHRLENTKQKDGATHPPIERKLNSVHGSALLMRTVADDFGGKWG